MRAELNMKTTCSGLSLSTDASLTVILPLRALNYGALDDRLTYCLRDRHLPVRTIEFLVVDDGSDKDHATRVEKLCINNGLSYLYVDSRGLPFSAARARNIGAMHALTEYIMFLDIDIYPYDGFYNDLVREIEIQDLEKYNNDFIMIRVVYLTRDLGRELFLRSAPDTRRNLFIQKLLENDKRYIERFPTEKTVNVYNRYTYLSHGGNDGDFELGSYAELEFNMRMAHWSNKFPLPTKVNKECKSNRKTSKYADWKCVYRLFGDLTFQKGIVLFHIPHDENRRFDDSPAKKINQRLFDKKYRLFRTNKQEPKPLPALNKGRTLLFTDTIPFIYNRQILPLLGTVFIETESYFEKNSISEYINSHQIDRVLMFNPYGTEQQLSLYRSLQQNNIDVLVAERGALRDSVFYDWNGFNAESSSYNAENWDKQLDNDQVSLVDRYIQNEIARSDSLEIQQRRIGAYRLRNILDIDKSKKVLFIPLQKASDSVIRHFCGPIKSYDNFIRLVRQATLKLGDDWAVVIKKHPLEDEAPKIESAIYSDANIKDLIELSHAVLLINSGVGLLSMLWNKPVYYCGDVFYGDERINRQVSDIDGLIRNIDNEFTPSKKTVYRFLYYLLEEFYSFGKFSTKEEPWPGGGRMTITTDIDYYRIRNIEKRPLSFYVGDTPRIDHDSILFDRYKAQARPLKGLLDSLQQLVSKYR